MDDPMMMFVIALVVLILVYLLLRDTQRNVNNTNNTPNDRDYGGVRGTERPRYDNPNVTGNGWFGNRRSQDELDWLRNSQRRVQEPSIREVGEDIRRVDSDNVRGRGGFGRDKG